MSLFYRLKRTGIMENEIRNDFLTANEAEETNLSKILNDALIRATDTYKNPPQIIWIDNSTIATLGNFSASTGKAKSKKTFNISAIVAAALANGSVLNYRAQLPEDKRRVLYVDTEQSRFHCHNVLERILKLAGLPTGIDCKNLDFIGLREYSPKIRLQVVDYALRTNSGYGLVIIDGIRDMMLDINNASESVYLINTLMKWSSVYDIHIHCVLHLNKGDDNVRGHIGTELNNKAETVLVITKDSKDSNISEVKALQIRDKEFSSFAFKINDEGLPEIVEDYRPEKSIKSVSSLGVEQLSIEQHKEALENAFRGKPIMGYENVINALIRGYAGIGYIRKRSSVARILSFLLSDARLIVKRDRVYYYGNDKNDNGNPDFYK